MRKSRKKYKRPRKPWDKERIGREKVLLKNFGLRRKREIWRAETLLRKYRRLARRSAANKDKKMEKELIDKLVGLGILDKSSELDDVLGLTVENILDRRLQSVVLKRGLTNTIKQSRQLIVHGYVRVGDRKVTYPSYLVPKDEEDKIQIKKMVK